MGDARSGYQQPSCKSSKLCTCRCFAAQHAGAAISGVLLPPLLPPLGVNLTEGRRLGLRMSGFTSLRDFCEEIWPTCLPAGSWF